MTFQAIIRTIFYGNYFYGVCAVALSIEALLQQELPLPSFLFFFGVFSVTVVYYSKAYITERPASHNERLYWYSRNRKLVIISQIVLILATLCLFAVFMHRHYRSVLAMTPSQLLLTALFPLVGLWYYGVSGTRYSLRNIGWLKPFVIGFAWAGLVTVYPVLFITLQNESDYDFSLLRLLLFMKNFIFVSALCILFDIKDYVSDSNQNLNTFVVKRGLRRTIHRIIVPLCLSGFGTFILYGINRDFHPFKIALNVIPFILVLAVAYSLSKRRSLLYYLFVVDGLMLVKAVCGSLGMIFF